MAEPKTTKVIRAWDNSIITTWWDDDKKLWANIRHIKINEDGESTVKVIRLTNLEIRLLLDIFSDALS